MCIFIYIYNVTSDTLHQSSSVLRNAYYTVRGSKRAYTYTSEHVINTVYHHLRSDTVTIIQDGDWRERCLKTLGD